ncbi:SDR family NAD(P)-dependent oxidoreductase [Caenibius sp. WL]|uniref:SDR family NAD(P)-dependent oxidoreductase n=1 Tax=Caenibius sp. WL TaxID=2872646 RepID=UPI001C9914D6|nr:SDR family NAD(P)-dependent oxidoreductase [Caenibius sp. WL]QZP08471.1 SDR family NAD(P)-dependent oxidoreductase [Caenibius sp. WL]
MTGQFGAKSTTDEVLDGIALGGKRALITGVSAGLGVETARALAARGAAVVGAARDLAKAEEATGGVRAAAAAGGGTFTLVELDLASLASVRACSDRLQADGRPFDIVIANAGVMATPFGHTQDGFETQFGTNHLGHFLLINRIAPLIADGGRVVILSSGGHQISDVDLADPHFASTPYDPWVAYGRAKTANALFAVGLDKRLRQRGIRACSVMPGAIHTDLGRYMTPETVAALLESVKTSGSGKLEYKTVPQGAATSVWAAAVADGDAVGGRYCEDCQIAETASASITGGGVQPYALDPENAEQLWAKSEELVGERF